MHMVRNEKRKLVVAMEQLITILQIFRRKGDWCFAKDVLTAGEGVRCIHPQNEK